MQVRYCRVYLISLFFLQHEERGVIDNDDNGGEECLLPPQCAYDRMTTTAITQEVFVAVDALWTLVKSNCSNIPSYGVLHEAKRHVLKMGTTKGTHFAGQSSRSRVYFQNYLQRIFFSYIYKYIFH